LRDLAPAVALLDLGDTERELGADEPPFGANMAFRRTVFSTMRFDVRLGPHADDQVRGEETTLCRALVRQGFRGVWVPSAKVRHFVVASRLTTKFVREYWTGLGRTQVRIDGGSPGGVPRWVHRDLVEFHARYLWQRARNNPGWVLSLMEASRVRGVWLEYRQPHAGAKSGSST